MIEYRLAGPLDAEDLAKVRIAFLVESNSTMGEEEKEALYKNLHAFFRNAFYSGNLIVWVAVEEGEIVGTGSISFYIQPPNRKVPTGKFAYITNMYTAPDYRGQGIASKLFSLLLDEAKTRGCEKITLNATIQGRNIYERYGFSDLNANMVYYSDKSYSDSHND